MEFQTFVLFVVLKNVLVFLFSCECPCQIVSLYSLYWNAYIFLSVVSRTPRSETLNCKISIAFYSLYLLWFCTHMHRQQTHTWMRSRDFTQKYAGKKFCIFSSVKWGGTNRMNAITIISEINTVMRFSFLQKLWPWSRTGLLHGPTIHRHKHTVTLISVW